MRPTGHEPKDFFLGGVTGTAWERGARERGVDSGWLQAAKGRGLVEGAGRSGRGPLVEGSGSGRQWRAAEPRLAWREPDDLGSTSGSRAP